MSLCPKCRSVELDRPDDGRDIVWACKSTATNHRSWPGVEFGTGFKQSPVCRIAELERDNERLRRFNDILLTNNDTPNHRLVYRLKDAEARRKDLEAQAVQDNMIVAELRKELNQTREDMLTMAADLARCRKVLEEHCIGIGAGGVKYCVYCDSPSQGLWYGNQTLKHRPNCVLFRDPLTDEQA